ncbi:HAD family phosphatase [Microbacterium sp. M28]|uniref:HAD family hydrolase n=1 Tax=Microbacterium sp. M28 TaxID=2962064 RepID=UPI0021F4C24E|nr:HAD family phosphatase [Microbacterium sp. M28]UYO98686.1 HAD family phosphatase [Microbacterium sp. M28]
MKQFILFDNDGVLVDTEYWYYKAGERALAEVGVALDLDQYLQDMAHGLGTWHQAALAGIDDLTIDGLKKVRNAYYRDSLRTERIEIDGVLDVLDELSQHVRMAIVTTSKKTDFELIHGDRGILRFMDFVLTREDYDQAKPSPEPYLTALERFSAAKADALVVEDSTRGLRSAVAAGIDCVVVHNEFTKTQDFSEATYRIRSLSELGDILS